MSVFKRLIFRLYSYMNKGKGKGVP
jgi:hypothetical protein